MVVPNRYPYHFWEFMSVTDHLMAIPKRHVESLHELDKDEQSEIMGVFADYQARGYNIYAREAGSPAKSVPHQHTHMIKTNNVRARLYFYLRKPYFLFRR